MALTEERQTNERPGRERTIPVAANAVIFAGAGVVLNASGYAEPASEGTGLTSAGRAEETVDNTGGANGAKSVRVRSGVFYFGNSASADALTKQDIGATAYWVDDETVARTDNSGARSPAGVVFDVDATEGVAVALGHHETLRPVLESGEYTPTLTGVTNVDSATLTKARYLRVGDVVHVALQASIDPTAGAVTQVRITLPVASNIGAASDVIGVASEAGGGAATSGGTVQGDAANDAALLDFTSASGTAEVWRAQFTYRVI